jgi:MarR family transcriptional regulator for hemolysin
LRLSPPRHAAASRSDGGRARSAGYWLRKAAQRWRRELGLRLRDLDLTPTQFDVLAATSWLGFSGTDPTQQDVADFSANDRMMTSRVVRTLEKRALLTRETDDKDSRTNRLRVTSVGQQLVTTAAAIAREVDREIFGSGDEVADVRARLAALAG